MNLEGKAKFQCGMGSRKADVIGETSSLGASMHEASIIQAMVIAMNEAQLGMMGQVRQVMARTQALEFLLSDDDKWRHGWIEQVPRHLGNWQLRRAKRGAVLA